MNERLTQFLAAENITQAQFADSINVARAGVSHILAGRNKPGWDFILSTMKRYPTLNIEWLISGKGKMYKNGTGVVNEGNGVVGESNGVVNNVKSEKVELDTLFDDVSMYNNVGDVQNSETVEPEPIAQNTPPQGTISQPTSHPYAAQQPVSQSVNQPAAVYMTPQNAPQTIVKKPNVAKIIVFFDDGTFQECK